MNLDDFSKLVKHTDKEREIYSYFDEHMTLYSLLATNFSDIIIDLKEDDRGCFYILQPTNNSNISYMKDFYNEIRVNFFSRMFMVEVSMQKEQNVMIRFVDKRGDTL